MVQSINFHSSFELFLHVCGACSFVKTRRSIWGLEQAQVAQEEVAIGQAVVDHFLI